MDLDLRILSKAMGPEGREATQAQKAWNTAVTPFRMMAAFSTMMENAQRLGRFKRATNIEGLSEEVGALQARDVTLDHARMGANVRSYNMITSWIGAAINGIDRFQTSFSRAPAATMVKTAGLVTLPTFVLWAMHKDEEWYQNLPDWERMLFWHIPTGAKDENGEPIIVKFPMPHQYGTIFGYMPIKMIEEQSKADPELGKELTKAVQTAYSVPIVPTAVTPLAEIYTNHSMFRDSPLVSQSQQQNLPAYQYTPYTSDTARVIAKTLAEVPGGFIDERFRTPVAIDHMIRGYTGTIGQQLVKQVSDRAVRAAGGVPDIDKPDPTIADNPVYGSFFMRNPRAGQFISDFYENAEKLDRIRATIEQEAVRQKVEEGATEAQARREAKTEVDRIIDRNGTGALDPAKARRAIGTLRQLIYRVHFDPEMPGDEKRQIINEAIKNQTAIAKGFNEAYEDYRRAEKEDARAN